MTKQQPSSLDKFKRSKRVTYIDAGALSRPQKITGASRAFAGIIVAAAVVVGGGCAYVAMDKLVLSGMRADAQVQEIIGQNLETKLPRLKNIVSTSNEETRSYLKSEGATLVDVPASKQDEQQMDVFAVGPNSSAEHTADALSQGMSKLRNDEFVKLTYGTWRLDVEQKTGYTVRIRYADYGTGGMESAMSRAMESQKLTSKDVSESGEDESGNTYKTGTVRIGPRSYTWRVSVLPLKDMYKVKGLPEDACFVGLRYTRN
ncbi:MAG: hypothetical protein Q4D06_02005 [Coriobacteriia bacterium]|nr:hypothetical protein [Coriobacteriia bacterium]